jgi:hypothetical protein
MITGPGNYGLRELFTDLLKAEREEDVTDALTVFGFGSATVR